MKVQAQQPAPRVQPTQVQEKAALEAAQAFESVFVHQMFKAMRQTVPEGGLTDSGFGGQVFTDMLDQKFAETTSKTGGFGLAETIAQELLGNPRRAAPSPMTSQQAAARYQVHTGPLNVNQGHKE